MMNMEKIWGYVEMVGETLIVIAAALWITHWDVIPYVFATGTLVFAVGRLAQNRYIYINKVSRDKQVTLKRLYRQRDFGILLLFVCSVVMLCVKQATYITGDLYLFPAQWLLPFIAFVVIEVYTAFRIPAILNNQKH